VAHPFGAILVAAGHSARMGVDKLWLEFWGRPAWRWSLDTLLATPGLERVALVVPRGAIERYRELLPPTAGERVSVVEGGESRFGWISGAHGASAA
jgi:2-C-methyl-D-erythritol 4-phosphate cytidylyltransferase